MAEQTFRDAWQANNEPVAFEDYCRQAFAPEIISAEIECPDSVFYFACINEEPAAYLKINFDRQIDELEGVRGVQIERIYVLQAFQGRGLGAEMLGWAEQCARETGAECLWLSVWQKSPRSVDFYKKNGFTICGTEIFWLGNDPQTDWLMKRRIAG